MPTIGTTGAGITEPARLSSVRCPAVRWPDPGRSINVTCDLPLGSFWWFADEAPRTLLGTEGSPDHPWTVLHWW